MTNKPHTGHLPEDNSWMSFCLLHQRLDDLLTWCRYPHPEPLSEGWLESVKEGIHAAIEQSLRDVQGNESLAEKLRDTKRLAFRLATQITNCPKLSTVPRREWTVPDDCISFDKLSKLNEEFGELGKVPISFRSPGREAALSPSEQYETDRQQTTDSPDLVISAMIAVLAREADRHPPTELPAQEAVASPSEITVSPAQDDSEWPRFSDTAIRLDIAKSNFSRLLDKGEILDNGKKGHQRRIDPSSILDYCKRTGTTYNEK